MIMTNIDPIALITHLKTNYGRIQLSDKSANSKRMKTPWNPPTPIVDIWNSSEKAKTLPYKEMNQLPMKHLLAWDMN